MRHSSLRSSFLAVRTRRCTTSRANIARTGNITSGRNDQNFRTSVQGVFGVGHSGESPHSLHPSLAYCSLTRISDVSIKVDDGRQEYWLAGTANVTGKVTAATGRGGFWHVFFV